MGRFIRTDWDAVSRRDRKLVAACLAGDEAAWMELWERYGPMITAVARRVGCTADEAEEVVQRTALVALEGLEALREPGKLAGWLAGVARYQAMAVIRERRPAAEIDPEIPVAAEPIHGRLEWEQDLAALRRAMLGLDERCRRLLTALYLEDPPASYRETARRLGLAASSVGPIRGRCLKRLKKLIQRMSQTGFPAH